MWFLNNNEKLFHNKQEESTQPRTIYPITKDSKFFYFFVGSQIASKSHINPEDFIHFEHLNRV